MPHINEDIGAYINAKLSVPVQASAFASEDTGSETVVEGIAFDLRSLEYRAHSVKVLVPYRLFFNASGAIFRFACDLQDRAATSSVGSTWANYGTTAQKVTITNNTTTTKASATGVAQFTYGKSLREARRYVRIRIYPTHTGTDTDAFFATTATGHTHQFGGGILVIGGAMVVPATATGIRNAKYSAG